MTRFQEAFEQYEKHRLTGEEAGELLGMSGRNFRRLCVRYEEDGIEGLRDRRIGKVSPRRTPERELERMHDLYRERTEIGREYYHHCVAMMGGLRGGAATWPLVARAQQPDRMRRIGVLHMGAESDHGLFAQVSRLIQGLAELGWSDGGNLRIDVRWAAGNVDRMRVLAKELVDRQPDVIFGAASAAVLAAKRETQTIPIVFANVADPVGDGFVASLPRPGGNYRLHVAKKAAQH